MRTDARFYSQPRTRAHVSRLIVLLTLIKRPNLSRRRASRSRGFFAPMKNHRSIAPSAAHDLSHYPCPIDVQLINTFFPTGRW